MLKQICLSIFAFSLFFAGDTPTVADKIIDFSMKNFGKKIDQGECWDLANAALNYSGAKWESPYGFGKKVELAKTQRADILQFANIKMVYRIGNSGGSMSFPKHTAIVFKANKKMITLIHQNFNNKRYVDTLTINLDDVKSGTIEAFRPIAK